MPKENEKGRDGSMDLRRGRGDGERWASASGTGILPLCKSGVSESGAKKMGFFRKCGSLHADDLGGMKDGCLTLNERIYRRKGNGKD
jgi:hypothetical protein